MRPENLPTWAAADFSKTWKWLLKQYFFLGQNTLILGFSLTFFTAHSGDDAPASAGLSLGVSWVIPEYLS